MAEVLFAVIKFVLEQWKIVLGAIVGGMLSYHVGHFEGYRNGYSAGQAALAVETNKALDKINAKAAAADARNIACVADPKCLLADDGWRINVGPVSPRLQGLARPALGAHGQPANNPRCKGK